MKTYELTGKHTYLSMAVTAGCLVVLLVCLSGLYKELAPRSTPREGSIVYHVTATFETVDNKSEGTYGDKWQIVHCSSMLQIQVLLQ